MAYSAYEQFIKAAGKFPRWTNIRRRPTESNMGKVLRSIFEEHENVIRAIEEYKKDFFIKYYHGREEEFLASLYIAQVGNIEDLDTFILKDPAYKVTTEEAVFYADDTYAFYQNGYIALYDTNTTNKLSYYYKNELYTADLIYTPVWNIFDEFAWWCGLERFPQEDNASLEQRCLSQFRRKPNSTEQGLKNAIINAASAEGVLTADEIEFIEPNETSLAWKNKDGISLFEEITQVNRDLARTRKWDIDYWDNAFRQLQYIPHVWDAEMDICRNGVGYHDALKVSTIRDVNQKNTTDITIKGYKLTEAEIEAYLLKQNIKQDIELELKRYNNEVVPLNVHYRIQAEDLIPVTNPEQILFSFYKQYTGAHEYYVDDFATKWDGLTSKKTNTLQKDKTYKLIFTAKNSKGDTMEISRCNLIENGNTTSQLYDDPAHEFRLKGGRVINTSVLFHGIKTADFIHPVNIQNNPQEAEGFVLTSPLENGSFDINLRDWGTRAILPQLNIDIDEDSGWNDITGYIAYIRPDDFSYNKTENRYISASNVARNDSLKIEMPAHTCRKLTLHVQPKENVTTAKVNINVYIDDKYNAGLSRQKINISNGYTFPFQQEDISHKVTIVITRETANQICVSDIRVQSYSVEIVRHDGVHIPYIKSMSIPSTPENGHITCIIHNNGNPISPLIRSCHIGPWQTKQYVIDNIVSTVDNAMLDIVTNCNITLWNVTDNIKTEQYHTHNTYENNTTEPISLALDLSSFDKIYRTVPDLTRYVLGQETIYYYTLLPGESIQTIYIHGYGYKLDRTLSLAEIVQLNSDLEETLYYAKSFNGFIIKDKHNTVRIHAISYDAIHFGDRIDISGPSGLVESCFVASGESEHSMSYTGAFDYLYLYDPTAKQYIVDHDVPVFQEKTTTYINPLASPMPKDNALLSYRILGVNPSNIVSLFYGTEEEPRDWSISKDDVLTIKTKFFDDLGNNNLSFVSAVSEYTQQTVPLSNTISLNGFSDADGQPIILSRYIISAPDGMEVSYVQQIHQQTGDEEGGPLYVMDSGFNKLYHSNIVSIEQIVINGRSYNKDAAQQFLLLLPEPGIIYWKDKSLAGSLINQVNYIYNEPVALRFQNIQDLYTKSGYFVNDAVESVNKEEYKIKEVADGSTFDIDTEYFTTIPDKIVATCSNPCYRAIVSGQKVTVSKIAEDLAPVIHNGFYYVDGKEYYFFANKYKKNLNKFYGLSIENGEIAENILHLFQESVNHLENSRMDRTQLTTHCLINFKWPRAQTNIDPLGHIGACESFSAWEDRNTSRNLTAYKNGLATKFTIQDNGYALLDITKFLQEHTTISCLYSGKLKFMLAKEMPILGQRSIKNVFCEPVQEFIPYHDIAYCIVDSNNLTGKYYLVVQGNGILDEVLIHNLTDPKDIVEHHVKAIDKLGIIITERNQVPASFIESEYTQDFIRYNCLETDQEGILRTNTTADWNITKIASFELDTCKTTRCLLRSNVLVAQADHATVETQPIEIKYQKSIRQAAFTINQYVQGNYKGFKISVYGSSVKNGTYREITQVENANLLPFSIGNTIRFIKFKIEAKENRIITDLSLFFVYKETASEDLNIFTNTEGSAVTKVFHIGAAGNYRFNQVRCEAGLDQYDSIYVRGAKKNVSEYVWTPWKNTEDKPEFYDCELFQYKICMKGKNSRLKILAFEFEVL